MLRRFTTSTAGWFSSYYNKIELECKGNTFKVNDNK